MGESRCSNNGKITKGAALYFVAAARPRQAPESNENFTEGASQIFREKNMQSSAKSIIMESGLVRNELATWTGANV